MSWPPGTKLGWAMPLSWPYINSTTHMSLFTINRPDFIYLEADRGGDITEKREKQVQIGMEMGCTHIILLDADMVYPPQFLEDLFLLLEDGADLAGIVCYRGYPPYNPLIWHPTEERHLRPFEDYQFGDIVDAGATGAACLLVKREVFEKVERPWFRFQMEEKEQGGKVIIMRRGEDTYFTRKATKAGFKLRISTKYDIGHLREMAVDRHFWITFAILNEMGSWENAFKLFQKLKDKKWFEREIVQPKNKKEVESNA
jgi:GT2 family glycosyltransferase